MALALDASTPAIATNTVGTTAALTSGSFTPPAGTVIEILWTGDALSTPATPTITDNLGTHIVWGSPIDWQSVVDTPHAAQGQAASWVGVVVTSTSMTVTVTSGSASGERVAALCVRVWNGANTAVPVGVHGKSASSSAASIAQSLTAQATGGWPAIAVIDVDTLGVESAGTGCSLIGSATVGSNFTYGYVQRTTGDDVSGNSNTLSVTIPGTSTNLSWVYLELQPAATELSAESRIRPRQSPPAIWQPGMPPYLRPERRFVETSLTTSGDTQPTGAGVLTADATLGSTVTSVGAGTLNAAGSVIATATLTGAGTLVALATQGASASPPGAGTLTVNARESVTTSLIGAGVLATLITESVTATLTGAGTLTANVTQSCVVSVAGAGVLSAAPTVSGSTVDGAAALAATGTLTASTTQGATLAPTGAGVLAATGSSAGSLTSGTAVMIGAGVLMTAPAGCQLPRPGTGTTARPTGTTLRPTGSTDRPGASLTARPATGDTDNPC